MKNQKISKKNKKTVFVGMSGGVDSSVSAMLLKEKGFIVVGVFIKTWHPSFLNCNEEEERRDAIRVCASLDIPFLTFDFEEIYKKEVAEYMINEYKKGRTPNPDVMCNKEVKFGAFLRKALSMGADYIATGHYAQIFQEGAILDLKKGRFLGKNLEKGKDPLKDQSYFLWTLKQNQLEKILFPVGDLSKKEVRNLAKKYNLKVAEKKDSQGICFLGKVDLKEFLKHYIKEKKGKVLNENNEVIGFHNGVNFFTLGERHGFTIVKKGSNDKPFYVIGKDLKKNILYVSYNKNYFQKSTDLFLLKNSSCSRQSRSQVSFKNSFCVLIKDVNWIYKIPKENKDYTAQIRYRGEFLDCKIEKLYKDKVKIVFKKNILVASGQSVVIYDNDIVLGGGIVE